MTATFKTSQKYVSYIKRGNRRPLSLENKKLAVFNYDQDFEHCGVTVNHAWLI